MITIFPKQRLDVTWPAHPLFFLAGPIQGGDDWQAKMCLLINAQVRHRREFYIAIPCRYTEHYLLRAYESRGGTADKGEFPRQLDWERHYLDLASKRGGIVFWLPAESNANPRADGNPYARDTYGELGEWRGRLMHDPTLRVFLGAEQKFPGSDVIQRNFCQALNRDVIFSSTMGELVDQLVVSMLGEH